MAKGKALQTMGACKHEQVGYRKGAEVIYICPEAHGSLWRRVMTAKGYRPTAARATVTA